MADIVIGKRINKYGGLSVAMTDDSRATENEKLEAEITARLANQNVFTLAGVTLINFKPHQFVVGPKHIDIASERGGVLTEDVLRQWRCAHPKCQLSYDEHTSNKVAALSLLQNCTNLEADAVLKDLVAEFPGKFEGFIFIDTEEQYRIANVPPTTETDASN